MIWNEGDHADYILCVYRGRVDVFRDEVYFETLTDGMTLDEHALTEDVKRDSTVITTEDTFVIKLHRDNYTKLCRDAELE